MKVFATKAESEVKFHHFALILLHASGPCALL